MNFNFLSLLQSGEPIVPAVARSRKRPDNVASLALPKEREKRLTKKSASELSLSRRKRKRKIQEEPRLKTPALSSNSKTEQAASRQK